MSALERLDHADGDTALTGWLARPAGAARGAVLLLPTIVNVNAAMERRATMLAEAGYLTLIADFYGEVPASFADAGPLAKALRETPARYRQRLRAGLAALRGVAGDLSIAAVGYCMGGQAALELARDGANIALAASFHGLLDTQAPAAPGAVRARILVCHGDADPMVPREQVLGFWQEMDAAGAQWHFHSYAHVRHGFTDPTSDARGLEAVKYNASADRQSWAALVAMMDEVFG